MRKLDPKSILILSIEWLRRAIYPLIIAVFANGRAFSEGEKLGRKALVIALLVPVLFGALAIVGGVVSYLVTRFGIVGGSLIVTKKGIWRQERTIPLERIQNVSITQGFLERILGIATVKVETASGTGVEANLKSLSLADANLIKHELLRTKSVASTEVQQAPPAVYKAEFKDVALAGALQNRALIVMATILGVFGQGLDDLAKGVIDGIERSRVIEAAEGNPALAGVVTMVGGLLFLLVGWVLSILYAVFIYFGFKVVRTDRGLQVSYGLVNTLETVIPIKRIQSIQTRASWLFKLFGYNQLFVQSIGGHHSGAQGQQHVATGQTLVAPICRPAVLRTLIRLINPALDVDQVAFFASDRFMRTRSIVRSCIFFGIIAIALSVAKARHLDPRVFATLATVSGLFFVAAVIGAFLAYRRQGYAHTPDAFMVCSGTLGQNVSMIPIGNVQAVSLESGWIQRRRGLVDLHVMTPVSAAIVPCIPRATAEGIMDSLMRQSFGRNRHGL